MEIKRQHGIYIYISRSNVEIKRQHGIYIYISRSNVEIKRQHGIYIYQEVMWRSKGNMVYIYIKK